MFYTVYYTLHTDNTIDRCTERIDYQSRAGNKSTSLGCGIILPDVLARLAVASRQRAVVSGGG